MSTPLEIARTEEPTAIPCPACRAPLSETLRASVWCGCGTEVRVFRFHPTRRVPQASPAAALQGTPCAYHAGNAATESCARCGSFLCELCATPLEAATYCTACFERMSGEGNLASLSSHLPRPHALALAAAFFALVPIFGLLFLPLSVWQCVKAWRRYEQLAEREPAVWAYFAISGLFWLGSIALSVLVLRAP